MPRKSMAAMSVAPLLEPVSIPDPPPGLTPEQATLWRTFLLSKDPDWFDQPAQVLLGVLVRHITTFERLCAQVERYDVDDVESLALLDKYLYLRDRESKAVASLMTKLRLTTQAKYDAQRASTVALRGGRIVKRPWEGTSAEAILSFANNGRPPQHVRKPIT